MKHRSIVISVLLLVAVIVFIIRFVNQPQKFEYSFYPMGGIPCKLVIYDKSRSEALEDAKLVEKEVEKLEKVFSIYRDGSEVMDLNNLPADKWASISPTMYDVFEKSLEWYGKSGGAFDVTIKPLVNLWKAAAKNQKLPTEKEIEEKKSDVGSKYITLSNRKGVKFSKDGVKLDFGGIAKGYLLDKSGKLLAGRGVHKYVFSCGGDVAMQGKKSFRVGIQDPTGKQSDLMMVFMASPGAVVTSGHYERFSEIDGKKYSHIINPATGRPVENALQSITVWANNATDADALATAFAVLGLEKTVKFLKKSDGYKAVLLAKLGEGFNIYYSKSLADKLEFKGNWANVPRNEF